MKSPLRLRCNKKILGVRVCHWRCEAPFKAAKFVSNYYGDEYAILHPSTKKPGKWQLSFFDELGAAGDREGTCESVLKDLSRREWKLAKIVR